MFFVGKASLKAQIKKGEERNSSLLGGFRNIAAQNTLWGNAARIAVARKFPMKAGRLVYCRQKLKNLFRN